MPVKHGILCILLWPSKGFCCRNGWCAIFFCLVMQLLWAPGHCSKALSPAEQRHWAHQCLGTPGEPLVALFLAFITVTKLTTVPLQWQLSSSGGTFSNLVSSAWMFPAPSKPNSFLSPGTLSSLLPHPCRQTSMLQFHSWLRFLHGIFSFWWHFYHGNRKISECFVKISLVSLFDLYEGDCTLPDISL